MAISIFPSTAAEFVSNNFVIDMNDTSNNTADTGGVKQAGPYSMSFSSGDSSFDVYLIDEDGNSVGYSNNTSIVASGLFTTVVIFGVATDEVVSFLYQGSVNNADGEGDEPGAGAYLESITPSDLPSIDDTATVIGGNFGADTEIFFDSGQTSLSAKNITVNDSSELIVTRPDGLIEDDAPYTLRAVTTGVPEPTGSNANLLVDSVTAGSDPTWVTSSPLNEASLQVAFSQTLEATDSDGTVVDYSVTAGTLTPGLSLDSSTGVLSGTPTATGLFTFTVTATDDGGNENSKQFEQAVPIATGGTIVDDGGFRYHTFTASDDFQVIEEITNAEYLLIAGGGGGGEEAGGEQGGGGGAGGLLTGTATIPAGTITITVGAGGAEETDGNDSVFGALDTAIGGGRGAGQTRSAGDGGSGGGSRINPGIALLGGVQGNDGAAGDQYGYGGGGGAGTAGQAGDNSNGGGNGGNGANDGYAGAFSTATTTGVNGGFYAGGGGGGGEESSGSGGIGGGGNGAKSNFSSSSAATPGVANTGGGGGGGANRGGGAPIEEGQPGGSGLVIVRYAF